MKITLTRDADAFADKTRALFESGYQYSLIASILRAVRAGRYGPAVPLFAYGTKDGKTSFAALRTPPWNLLATEIDPASARQLVAKWLQEDPELPGVSGPRAAARPITEAWRQHTGGEARCRLRELAYVLDRVTEPRRPAPGTLRTVRDDELTLAREWMRAFGRETKALPDDRADLIIEARAADRCLYVWDDDGPCSLLATTPPVAGTVRIGPVYTPPEHRRRGYAGTAVAAASREALAGGARHCALYTDVTNPTSNKIYAEIGYRQVGEHEEWEFERAG